MEQGLGDRISQAVMLEAYAMNGSRYLSLGWGEFCGVLEPIFHVWYLKCGPQTSSTSMT